ncbi:ATP-dependent protease HslVU (ClpYQ) peptidase subunit [Oxalobacteraceae bacterium GrIS 2.11]
MATQKTLAEVEVLKERWARNPNGWKLEDKEGYEEHRAELTAFSNEMHEKWQAENHLKKMQTMLNRPASEMTIYDHYAGLAMQTLIAKGGKPEEVVRDAFDLAHRMAVYSPDTAA